MILLALRMVDNRWAITIEVRPFIKVSIACCIRRSLSVSTDEVASSKIRIEGLESGANSYIPKPFYPDHLMVRIQKLLEEKEMILRHFTQDVVAGNAQEISLDSAEKAFIKVFIDHIKQNIDNENLNSAFIEKNLGMSTSQLYRKTKEAYGLSPGDLIRTIRLKYAAELLRKNVLTVSEVCYKSGFNNRSYFYREFKKVYNTTPKSYQLDYKAKSAAFINN